MRFARLCCEARRTTGSKSLQEELGVENRALKMRRCTWEENTPVYDEDSVIEIF